ncbi:MerR family transcriptional regulator [Bacillus sp. AFS040349]|uniref:MerR family transcriptional regulator n=1 Tax=Bacillus sp. AFS040349 TaxID=2033502 RepID=UPI000BFB7915|nr:MerR family transcriptional regulator [Bacillus sp. AFS040349]PGT89642.1 chromosome segregation protein [Bacillus sp. AFS040349]
MSTAAVAKSLGVSRRTLMRWVDQLDLELEKNELGHYQFSDADIERLKQLQNNPTVTPTPANEQTRKGTITQMVSLDESKVDSLTQRIEEVERKVQSKADGVVSYQLLQHRREMEELQSTIKKLELRIEELEQEKLSKKQEFGKDPALVFDQTKAPAKPSRRKGLISSILGF